MKITNSYSQNRILAISCLCAAFALAACQKEGPAETAGKQIDQTTEKVGNELENAKSEASKKAEAAGDYIDDSMITAKVKEALIADDLLKASQIEVTTDKGVVKLSGNLDSEQLVGRAVELANTQKNVKSVQNDLRVAASK
ncbi:MAG: BON domain-containing protein [Methylomonas sp.]|jgi:hyperosmotically inducible protein